MFIHILLTNSNTVLVLAALKRICFVLSCEASCAVFFLYLISKSNNLTLTYTVLEGRKMTEIKSHV